MAGDKGLRFCILGPLLVLRGGVAVSLPHGRVSVLLAALAMSPGQQITADRLADVLWPEKRPERVRDSLQTQAARLRAVVPGVVVTAGDGYLLDVDADQVDLLRFRGLARAAEQASEAEVALSLLDQALGLWRGEPLAGLRSAALEREVVPALVDERLAAVRRRAELELAAGRHDRVIAELRGLTGLYPIREPLWGLLLRALAAARPAEAISEYHRARESLAAELGVDPSPELQDLYRQLLHADSQPARQWQGILPQLSPDGPGPATQGSAGPGEPGSPACRTLGSGTRPGDGPRSTVPHQLPADTCMFTGRKGELTRLLALGSAAGGAQGPGTVVISAIDGMAGVGKTALAVCAAHRLVEQFDDGQLFIDLRGYNPSYPPRPVSHALGTLLRALGVQPRQIPDDIEERAALYRERLRGTRTLIVLDNAADEAQVRPLIPGGAGCLVLVTSRRKLQGLDEAHAVALDVLAGADATELFCMIAGPGRVAADDPVVTEIVGLCGQLPLAVRIAAAMLRNRPAWSPEHLASRLRAARTRLDVLSGGDRNIGTVFGLSTRALPDSQRRLYRYLGLIPGPDIDSYAAAALLDTDPAAVEHLLQELVDQNLLLEPTAGRYQMHDLIRDHARAFAASDPARSKRPRSAAYSPTTSTPRARPIPSSDITHDRDPQAWPTHPCCPIPLPPGPGCARNGLTSSLACGRPIRTVKTTAPWRLPPGWRTCCSPTARGPRPSPRTPPQPRQPHASATGPPRPAP